MTALQKFLTMTFGIALVTTLILPNRQTVQVINAGTGLLRGTLATAMGTGKTV